MYSSTRKLRPCRRCSTNYNLEEICKISVLSDICWDVHQYGRARCFTPLGVKIGSGYSILSDIHIRETENRSRNIRIRIFVKMNMVNIRIHFVEKIQIWY
jgi:hypothetical protein